MKWRQLVKTAIRSRIDRFSLKNVDGCKNLMQMNIKIANLYVNIGILFEK